MPRVGVGGSSHLSPVPWARTCALVALVLLQFQSAAASCLDTVSNLNCSGYGTCVLDTTGMIPDGTRCECVPARFERSLVPSRTVDEPYCGLGLWDFPTQMEALYGINVIWGAIELVVVSFLLVRIYRMKLLIVNLRCVALGFILVHALFQCFYHIFSFGSTFSREWELIFAASMDPWVSTAYNIVLLFWRKLAQRALQRPFSLRAMTVTALITLPMQIIVIFITAFSRRLEFYLIIYIAYLTLFSLAFLLYTVRIKSMVAELNAMAAAAVQAAQRAQGKPSPPLVNEPRTPVGGKPPAVAKRYEVQPAGGSGGAAVAPAGTAGGGEVELPTNSVRSAWKPDGAPGPGNTAAMSISIRAVSVRAPAGGRKYNSVNEKVTRLATVNACICLCIVGVMAFWIAVQDRQGPEQYMWFYGVVRSLGSVWALAIIWAFWEPPPPPSGAITVRVLSPTEAAKATSGGPPPPRLTTPPQGAQHSYRSQAQAQAHQSHHAQPQPHAQGSFNAGHGSYAGGAPSAVASYAPSSGGGGAGGAGSGGGQQFLSTRLSAHHHSLPTVHSSADFQ